MATDIRLSNWIEAALAAGDKPETTVQAAPNAMGGARTIPRTRVEDNLLTPARFGQLLRAAQQGDLAGQAELFEVMEERDGEMDGHLRTRREGVANSPWELQPADDTPLAEEATDYCREVLRSVSNLEQARLDLLDAIGKGFSALQIHWDKSAEEWLPRRLEFIPQRWFTCAPDGQTIQLATPSMVTGEDLKPLNWIVHRVAARSGFAWRQPLLRSCSRAFIVRHFGWKDWLGFAEVYGMPLRIGKLSDEVPWDSQEAQQFWTAVQAIGHDYAAVIRGSNEIEIKDAAQGNGELYERLIERAGRELALAILGQTLTSGGESGGSYALGAIHNQVRQDLREADARAEGQTWTDQLLTLIVRLNLSESHPIPRWVTLVQAAEDLSQTATTVQTLVSAGLRVPASWAYKKFGIPEPVGDEAVLAPAPQAPAFGGPAAAFGLNEAHAGLVERQRKQQVRGHAQLMHDARFRAYARSVGESPEDLAVFVNQAEGGPISRIIPKDGLDWMGERRFPDQAAWDALSPAGRQRAWWVTGVTQEGTAKMADALMDAVRRGLSENDLLSAWESLGLSVPGSEEPGANQIANWQARLVARNGRRSAYNAQNWIEAARDAEMRPYGKWLLGADPCPICDPLGNTVAPLGGKFFSKYWPQLHHDCHCEVVTLSARDLAAEGITPDDEAQPLNAPQDWVFDRGDAYYQESKGGAPRTDAGRADAALLANLPSLGDLL